MIDVYHCPKCSRLLRCEGVISIGGYELPVFQCEDCIVKKTMFGPGTEEFEVAYTFCADSAGRCVDPSECLGEEDDDPDLDDDSDPDPSLNYSPRSAIKEQTSVRATQKVRGLIVEATSGASRQARFSDGHTQQPGMFATTKRQGFSEVRRRSR